jgi:hypothetical protein
LVWVLFDVVGFRGRGGYLTKVPNNPPTPLKLRSENPTSINKQIKRGDRGLRGIKAKLKESTRPAIRVNDYYKLNIINGIPNIISHA